MHHFQRRPVIDGSASDPHGNRATIDFFGDHQTSLWIQSEHAKVGLRDGDTVYFARTPVRCITASHDGSDTWEQAV